MEKRKCLCCGDPIPSDKRADSKFCSNSCKAKYWEDKKGKEKITANNPVPKDQIATKQNNTLEGLRGVIDSKAKPEILSVKQTSIPSETKQNPSPEKKVETQAYKTALAKKTEADAFLEGAKKTLLECEKQIRDMEAEKKKLELASALNRYNIRNPKSVDVTDLFGDQMFFQNLERKVIDGRLFQFKQNKVKAEKDLDTAIKKAEQAKCDLENIPRFEITEEKDFFTIAWNEFRLKQQAKKEKPIDFFKEADPLKEEETIPEEINGTETPITIQTDSKLISSKELKEMDYKCLNFQGRWKEFFGQPAVVFHLLVHGKSGEGKSTFCIQEANYFAEHFGNVVYISGEEGFSKTLRDKVINTNALSPHLFFADYHSYEEIIEKLENKFHFIFLDSLNTLDIDTVKLRELRKRFPDSAFITICQSTKEGKMRGSNEIVHDSDIVVEVKNGIAETTKNRFKEKGMQFNVFPKNMNDGKGIAKPRNVI